MYKWLVAICLLVAPALAAGETYSRDGYSIALPSGWRTMDRGDPKTLQQFLSRCGLTSDQTRTVSCIAVSPDSQANLVIAVVPYKMPLDEVTLQQFLLARKSGLARQGLSFLDGNTAPVAGRKALVFTCNAKANNDLLTQRVAMVASGERTYVIALAAPAQQWHHYHAQFEQMLASLNFSQLTFWLTMAAAGMLGTMLLIWIVRKRQDRERQASLGYAADGSARGRPYRRPPAAREDAMTALGPTLYDPPGM